MIANYYKVALRNIVKRKLYSFINSFGLSIGIAFCLFIYLFIQDEKSFDQFHINKKSIYLISNKRFDYMAFKNGEKEPFEETVDQNAKLGEVIIDELAGVQRMTRYVTPVSGLLRYQEKVFNERFTGVDSGFFKMFSFKLLEGNQDNLFKNDASIVLTPKIAEKYFGKEDPLGKLMTLDINGERTFTVIGVMEAPPSNSSLSFDILLPIQNIPRYNDAWDNHSFPTFLTLSPEVDLNAFEVNLNAINQKYTGASSREFRERERIPDEFEMEQLYLTPFTDIHLNTKIKWEKSSDPKYSFILGGIAILILVIGCINYISLALTSSTIRGKEVGIRKVSGAARSQLIFQFWMESIALAFISLVIGLVWVVLFLPAFNAFTNKDISLNPTNLIEFISLSLLLTTGVGIIAGSYPALYLSRLKPALVLKGRFTLKVNGWFTKPLMTTQFGLSAFLIMSSVVMYKQMKFIATKDLGYNQHQVLSIPIQQGGDSRSDAFVENFRSALENAPSILSIGASSIPFTYGTLTLGFRDNGEAKTASSYIVDPSYIPTLEIPLLEGRNFNVLNPSDLNNAVIVNESLVKEMKWTDPLNEHLNWHFEEGLGSKVIGVVKDHHFLSLERPIGPMFLTMDKTFGHYQYMLVKILPTDISGSIKTLEKTFKSLAPDKPFEYEFLDEKVAMQYQSYERWMNIMELTTGFAILISCLGLFGLAGTNVVNRTKEIGIRKVLGSEWSDIFLLLNKQFFWLSVIAFVLAIFPAWYTMNKWLNSFQFKVEIGWLVFAISMVTGLFVVLITISYHTIKAIHVNPADTLKCE